MKKQIILYILLVFAVFVNAQTIPKSINNPVTPQIKKGPEKDVKEKIQPFHIWKKKFDYVGGPPWRGLYHVSLNNKWGFVNKNGKIVIPLKYDDVEVDIFEEIKVSLNNKWGLINETGTILIAIKYDDIDNFRGGLATVKLNGKYGFINKSGQLVIPFKYDYAFIPVDGGITVRLNGKEFIIDKNGNCIKDCD